jgi:WhiB family redox-sensing transcriptional regulator
VGGPFAGQHDQWITNRYMAHTMRRRGQPIDAIAEHLGVAKRSVHRYLAAPCPDKPVEEPKPVALADFFSKGVCTDHADLMHSRSPAAITKARAVCARCPVLEQCRLYGITKGRSESGIWGGLTKDERQRADVASAAGKPRRRGAA